MKSLAAFLGLAAASFGHAAITLPSIIGSNMVLQSGAPVPIWGRAAPAERVTVEFAGQRVSTTADTHGEWRVALATMPASDRPAELVVRGENTLRLSNVLVGEVWLCSGQSNMTFRLEQTDNAVAEAAQTRSRTVRFFTVARRAVEAGPQWDCKGEWVECTPETAAEFSAVGYYFGRELQRRHGWPVGLIHSSWGGTRAEAWTPRATLAGDATLQPILAAWQAELADFPRKKAEFETQKEQLTAEWKKAVARAEAAGRMPPSEPRLRTGPDTQHAPCGLYNAMIAPLVPFALRGVAWYQGEANVAETKRYQRLFPALIESWRQAWAQPALPFVWVQLPNLNRKPEPSKSGWAEMREAQLKSLSVPHTAMAVTIDVGDPRNLHPTNKRPVGERLARAADALVYGADRDTCLSPVPRRWEFLPDGSVRIECDPAVALATRDAQPPIGFVLAGEDRKFFPARAELHGNAIVLRSADVPRPAAARHAWADNPTTNVVSPAGLPLSPFRTDQWPTPASP